jgi:protoporphyrinogen oxidase
MPRLAVIAGAGPAGLTAAYELLKRTEVVPLVVEQTDAIGGIAQTHNYRGNRIDIGGHRFFSKSERVMNWWFNILPLQGSPSADTDEKGHEIDYATEAVVEFLCRQCVNVPALPGETRVKQRAPDPERQDEVMLQRPRLSRIYYRRGFFPYPIGITLSVAARLGWWNTFRIGVSYVRAQLFPEKDETYLDAFFVNRFGRRLYETFFRDYTEKVWGVKCHEIRADWGAQRVKGLSLLRALTHAVRDLLSSEFKKRQAERETSLITRFFYPKYGPGQMWETVARHVDKCGGQIRMRTRVVGVEVENSRVASVTLESLDTGATETVECDYFFSTMPIRELAAIINPALPASVSAAAAGLQYRDFLTVGLLLRKLHVQERGKPPAARVADNWIYVQDGGVRVGRIQIFNNWSPYMVADHRNTVWIGLEYFVDEGDDLWQMRDRDLVAFGVRELELIGFLRGEDVLDGCVLRMPKAYPAYFGTYDRLDEIQTWANTVENLFLIGRNGMHRYNNQDHSMLTAMLAVDNIVGGRVDKTNLWDVNLEMVYHEEAKPAPASTPERVRAAV